MLFSIKKSTVLSIAATLVFASLSLLLKYLIGIDWNLYTSEATLWQFILALGFILASDLAVCLLLVTVFHTSFVRLWMEMAGYFSVQRLHTILAGGLLAAGEEMFFRGILLQYMVETLDFGNFSAVTLSAAVFAIFHVIRKKRLALFSLWAFLEGVILGAIYLYTGSLPVVMAAHAAHDIAGFALFSLQRRRGFLVLIKHPGF
ncbi:MAG: type II CAAX endopeptidase family protein [Thermodesulfobacteriota bacterium]